MDAGTPDGPDLDLDLDEAASTARRMWVRFEAYHDVTYFTPESRAATDALGCRGGWMGYFGMRAAPLGAAAPETVVSAFYNFHPSMVRRALPDAWAVASPARFLKARLAGVDGALRRLLGDAELAGPEIAEAAGLAVSAAEAAPTAGRPLAAANAVLDRPAEPHLALWQATTLLRESRGDGHVAALVAAGLDPCEALVLFGADHGLDPAYLRAARRWPAADWAAAQERLAARGLLAPTDTAVTVPPVTVPPVTVPPVTVPTVTDRGRRLRGWIEDSTDRAAAAPWAAIGTEATRRLADLLGPLALRIAEGNDAMRTNPMALDATRELRA